MNTNAAAPVDTDSSSNLPTAVSTPQPQDSADCADQSQTARGKLSYKDKFRSRVKTKLSGVKDRDLEDSVEGTPKPPAEPGQWNDLSHYLSNPNVFDPDNDSVYVANSMLFAKKTCIVLSVQFFINTMWVLSICPNKLLFKRVYLESESLLFISALILVVIYTSLTYWKRIAGSLRFQVFVWTVLTISLSYLFGGLCLLFSYAEVLSCFFIVMGMLWGSIIYCSVNRDEVFKPRAAACWGALSILLATITVQAVAAQNWWALLLKASLAAIIGATLLLKIDGISVVQQSDLKMKHYVYFAMMLYLDLVTVFVKLFRSVSDLQLRGKPLQKDPVQAAEPRSMFKFVVDADESKHL